MKEFRHEFGEALKEAKEAAKAEKDQHNKVLKWLDKLRETERRRQEE